LIEELMPVAADAGKFLTEINRSLRAIAGARASRFGNGIFTRWRMPRPGVAICQCRGTQPVSIASVTRKKVRP